MRRTFFMLAAALLAALPPVVAGAGNGDPGPAGGSASGSPGAADVITTFGQRLAAGEKLTFPLPDVPGPATLSRGAQALVDSAAPGAILDLVVTLDRPADARIKAALASLGVWSHTYEQLPSAAVRIPVARLPELRNLRGVLAVYENKRLHHFLKESATLNNTGHAWNDLGVTGKGVTVAIIDTGVDFTHPDLAPAMKANVKIAGLGNDPLPLTVPIEGLPNSDTSSGHGTHVAGDAAGRGTVSGGAHKGMGFGADLVGIGTGEGLSIITALEGYDWMLENREKYGIRVVNNSYGTGFEPFDPMQPVQLATKRAVDAGIVVVFANGNDGDEMSMNPYAAAPWVLPVAAGSKSGSVTDFSSGGIEADTVGMNFARNEVTGEARTPLNMGLYHPAITATGEDVVSTRANGTLTPVTSVPEDRDRIPPDQLPYYSTLSGTSMAAPEAAGIVAMLLEANPALTPLQVREVLQITARWINNVPFYKQGYGYVDASAAVELARTLKGRPPAEIQSVLESQQAARDQQVLDRLAHPNRTYAYTERSPLGAGTLSHNIEVAPGTERVKVIANGGSLPFVGVTAYEITVKDAEGQEVGSTTGSAASGTTVLDLDLRKLDGDEAKAAQRFSELKFGTWTADVGVVGALVPPMDTGQVDDLAQKRFVTTLISVFGAQSKPCRTVPRFAPVGITEYRFQDDNSSGPAFPANPEYTYVGPVPNGSLGTRAPERRLAGTFGQATSRTAPPEFVTAPLTAPMTIGGASELRAFIQGPGEMASGLLSGELLDRDPAGTETVIGQSPKGVAARASSTEPLETIVPIAVSVPHTVKVGHQIAVRLKITFIGTSGHTLFYDSDKYPSGVRFQTGQIITGDECPGLLDKTPGTVASPGPASGGKKN